MSGHESLLWKQAEAARKAEAERKGDQRYTGSRLARKTGKGAWYWSGTVLCGEAQGVSSTHSQSGAL